MPGPVLILGGYGNFGKRIAHGLTQHNIPIVIAGRSADKATALRQQLSRADVQTACFDIDTGLDQAISNIHPSVVSHTCGPFQDRDYREAECCIRQGVHYIDLADGREFVSGITRLGQQARQRQIAVISGASTVPGLSSAVLEHIQPEFSRLDSLDYGISLGQKTERGLATVQAILSYVGQRLKPFPGDRGAAYGWQDLHRIHFPKLGRRWMANCDIPDLDLLPARYGIRSIRFSAGLESNVAHLGLWALSWVVRAGLSFNLSQLAKPLLSSSKRLDAFGSANGGMHMQLKGIDQTGQPHMRTWFILAFNGHGPNIPTVPAVILAKKLAQAETEITGATTCIGLVTLEEYLDELKHFDIETMLE
ncbi:MAG: saccharopine dehydrogenase NADP-binding domain-containing protein [Pseudomonadota bacterium]